MKNITLYVIRHGETYLNKYKKMQGWSDAPLTEKGIKEAVKTGERLKNVSFDAIYASDLGRTKATAELIRNENVMNEAVPIILLKELRETFYGSLDGSFSHEVYQRIAKKLEIHEEDLFKTLSLHELAEEIKGLDAYQDAETMNEVTSRLAAGLTYILESAKEHDSRIMVVTHGNIIRTLVSMLDPTVNVQRELKNSGITTIAFHGNDGEIIGFDE